MALRPAREEMMKQLSEKGTADLLFTLTESGVELEEQYDLVVTSGYHNLKKYCGIEDTRAGVRAALILDLTLDPTAAGAPGKYARLALASLITAWDSGKERLGKETQLRTEARVFGVHRQLDVLERHSMKKAVEALFGDIPIHEAPSSDYISHKVEQLEDNDPSASPLDEINSMADVDLSVAVPGHDASGSSRLFRKRQKGSLPLTPEAFRTRLRIEKNLWLYLSTKFVNRSWLAGLTPSPFEAWTDYFLGRKVYLLEVCNEDGTKRPLSPPWNIVLSYELECRKEAIRKVVEEGIHLGVAMAAVIRDPELKELAFTSPVAHLGRSRTSNPPSIGGAAQQISHPNLLTNPNWPNKKRPQPYAPSVPKGKGKGKVKGGGKARGKGKKGSAPDGRQICFSFNGAAGCTDPRCARAHICRLCMGTHTQGECPTASSA